MNVGRIVTRVVISACVVAAIHWYRNYDDVDKVLAEETPKFNQHLPKAYGLARIVSADYSDRVLHVHGQLFGDRHFSDTELKSGLRPYYCADDPDLEKVRRAKISVEYDIDYASQNADSNDVTLSPSDCDN
jgi:hypothetical protein